MNVILFEDSSFTEFLPLVFTRPVGMLRCGIRTLEEKWAAAMHTQVFHRTRSYLQPLYPVDQTAQGFLINARVLPTPDLLEAIHALQPGECLMHNDLMIAGYFKNPDQADGKQFDSMIPFSDALLLKRITDLFTRNAEALAMDFDLMVHAQSTQALHPSNTLIGDPSRLFIAEGAKVWASTLNTTEGPIYIDRDAEVMEGSHIRGPFYLGEHATLKMGSRVYGATTIGPHCKVGGEISNSVIHGYSNKAHDGFIGNTVIGEWCNLGADTNTSNLKNNYSPVRIFSYLENGMADTNLTFCGLIMGDHSKCSINTMFNTGTVAGVGVNVFGGGFPPKHIPSFSWGGVEGIEEYDLSRMLETAEKVYERRGLTLTNEHRDVLAHVFEITREHRR